MGHMIFNETSLLGLFEVTTEGHSDPRGSFVRTYCDDEFAILRAELRWKQINLSRTAVQGTVRGMHFQRPPHAEVKLIRCIRGRVFDVAVDIRAHSPTYLRWHAVELTEDNDRMLFIPEGFAHGFQTLTSEAHLIYMHSSPWMPGHEGQLRYDDPAIAIAWPLPPIMVSERDLGAAMIDSRFKGLSV